MGSKIREGNTLTGRFGADKKADETLFDLPRREADWLNARVWIDASGRLNILVDDSGWLWVAEEDLGCLHGEEHTT